MKKVLILGVNGFIGHHLSKRILETTDWDVYGICLLYTSPSPRDGLLSRMPSSA